jgi:cyclopropane-fatty-acyl-phospholipid synthase
MKNPIPTASSDTASDLDQFRPTLSSRALTRPLGYQATRLLAGVLNSTQLAMAEAYINGIEIPDSTFRSILNLSMPILFKRFPALLAPYEWVLSESDRMAESSDQLMKLQYDLPQTMLNVMLGDSPAIYPKYSTGFWDRGATNLETSQMHMIDQVIERLDIADGDNILDFGCGWGCVPNYILSKFPNVRMTGLNLSQQQCQFIRRKMEDPSSNLSSGRFTLVEGDMNDVEFPDKFDKVLSIGVFEHVGNLTSAFQKLASFLKSDGKVLIHIITVRTPNNISSGFTHKYIFPHGRYWSHDAVPSHDKDLKTVKRWYMNGMNYHKTLTSWLNRFDASQDITSQLNYDMNYAKWRRIWRFYLIYLGTSFVACDGEYNGNGQYILVPS